MKLMATLPEKSIDLAIVDPPYFNGPNKLGYDGKGYSSTGVKRLEYKKISKWDIPKQKYYNELCRVSNNQIIWGINYFAFTGIGSGRIIWDKQKNRNCTFSDGEIAYCSVINSVRFFRFRWDGMIQGDMKNREYRIHPTQKPVVLYKWILSKYAEPGMKILDTHLGSGSIAVACNEMGYSLTACEIDKDYFNAACKRIEEAVK
jgi:site-specific DNA-methyltransferase (adenine-specific)